MPPPAELLPPDVQAPDVDQLRRQHGRLLSRLREVAAANGHDPDRLRIVGVTKGHPVVVARAAVAAGLRRLGESRVQEAEPKVAAVPEAAWHFVGRLQSNKVRRVVRAFVAVHSVDSAELLARLDRVAEEEELEPDVLLQVNVSGEPSKAGWDPDAVLEVRPPRVARLVGLMTIAPLEASPIEARAVFARLRRLRDALRERLGLELAELSMGMSADAEAAAAEGATLVRIGTALFGPRT